MTKFWNFFWKIFAGLLVLGFAAAVVVGFVLRSTETAYIVIRTVFTVGFGVCGVIGLIVVPIDLYIEYRQKGACEHTGERLDGGCEQ